MNKRNILITGATGFIGNNLAEYLQKKGYPIIGLSRKQISFKGIKIVKTDYSSDNLKELIQKFRPKLVIHSAGPASVNFSFIDPSYDFSSSVLLTKSLLEGVIKSGTKPIIYFLSSAAVYGSQSALPIKETAQLNPISPYGYHRLVAELLAKEYANCYNIPIVILRLFSVFGYQQKRLLFWEIFSQFQKNKKVIIQGSGNEKRDYLYINDLVWVCERLIKKVKPGYHVINVASGTTHTVREITLKIKSLLNSNKAIIYLGKARRGDPDRWKADVRHLQTFIGKDTSFNFNHHLEETIGRWKKQKY